MASQPALSARIQEEADALFADGDPAREDFNPSAIDVTHRFLMECLRMYPIVPMSVRTVMNSCVVESYELPVGHRYTLPRRPPITWTTPSLTPWSSISTAIRPRAMSIAVRGTPRTEWAHTCLGSRWMELLLAVDVLMLARYFEIKVSPADYKLKFSPLPSMKPSKKLKFLIAEQRRELPT